MGVHGHTILPNIEIRPHHQSSIVALQCNISLKICTGCNISFLVEGYAIGTFLSVKVIHTHIVSQIVKEGYESCTKLAAFPGLGMRGYGHTYSSNVQQQWNNSPNKVFPSCINSTWIATLTHYIAQSYSTLYRQWIVAGPKAAHVGLSYAIKVKPY